VVVNCDLKRKRRWFLLDFCRYAGALGNITNLDEKYTLTERRTGHLQSTKQRRLGRPRPAIAYVTLIDLES